MTTRNVPIGQLQAVINASAAGDVLNLAPGVHMGSVAVAKRLTIDGLDAATVNGPLTTIKAQAQGITLRRLKVTGSTGVYNALVLQTASDLTLDSVILEGIRPADPNVVGTCFGIRNYRTSGLQVQGGEWSRMAQGVEFNRSGQNSVVSGVYIHDIDRMVVNDTTPGTDTGANPFVFYHSVGPIAVRNCRIERVRAPSYDYKADGSAFEFYGAGVGGVVIEDNEVRDSLHIAETGKSAGDADYDNVIFRRNRFYGNPGQVTDATKACNGLLLRSAKNWTIEDNEFTDIDWWVLAFDYTSTAYSGALANIVARRNIVNLKTGVNRWLSFGASVPYTVFTSNDNTVYQPAGTGNVIAEKAGGVKTTSLATWRAAAPGHEVGSVWTVPPPTETEVERLTRERDEALAQLAAAQGQIVTLQGQLATAQSQLSAADAEVARLRGIITEAQTVLAG